MRHIRNFLSMILLLTCVQAVSAASTTDDKISMEESWMIKGEQQAINLQLTNASLYTALQCDLFLPEGLTLARNEQSALQISLAGSNAQSHIIESSPLSNGGIRIVAMSMQNVAFSSNTIATLTISASVEAVGQKTIEMKNVRLVTAASRQEQTAPSTTAMVNVMEQRAVLTAKNYTRRYGEGNPAFEITTEGPAVDGQPEIICEATATSPVGTYPILVKPGTIRNTCVDYVAGTLTIEKAPLTISAGTYVKKQGDAMPEFTLTYDGFKNGETKDVLTKLPTVTCEANEATAPGEYPVTVSGAEARNYMISYTNGKLVVTEADAVVITAKNYTRKYGDANPAFEYDVEGAALDGTPEITCEALATSPVGTYDIIVKQGSVTNYNVTYVAGTLTIEKAVLTVTAQNCSRQQGQENPDFTLTYAGWKNGEDENVLLTKPTASTTATKDSPIGEYAIKVSGGDARNYTFEYVDGILTVAEPTGIAAVHPEADELTVFTIAGNRLTVKSLKELPQGIYIVNGRKLAVRR